MTSFIPLRGVASDVSGGDGMGRPPGDRCLVRLGNVEALTTTVGRDGRGRESQEEGQQRPDAADERQASSRDQERRKQ